MVVKTLLINIGGGFHVKVHEIVKWADRCACDVVAFTETHLCARGCSRDHNCRFAPTIPSWTV